MRIRAAHKAARTCINRARKNVRGGTSGTETDRIRKQLRRVLCIIRSRNTSSPFAAVNEALTCAGLSYILRLTVYYTIGYPVHDY